MNYTDEEVEILNRLRDEELRRANSWLRPVWAWLALRTLHINNRVTNYCAFKAGFFD